MFHTLLGVAQHTGIPEEVIQSYVSRGWLAAVENKGTMFLHADLPPGRWKPKKSTEAPFSVNIPDNLQDVFLIEKDSKKFPATKGWAYAAFDYDTASDTFKPDPTGVVSCGFACHSSVAAKDYIFTAYGKR